MIMKVNEQEVRASIRHLGPSDCQFIDVPYLDLYLSPHNRRALADHWYQNRVRVHQSSVIKIGANAGKLKCNVGLRNRDRSIHYLIVDPKHLVKM
jgi:hypothetical protein